MSVLVAVGQRGSRSRELGDRPVVREDLARIDNGLMCAFLAGQLEPPRGVLNDPSCYHFRALDPVFRSESTRGLITAAVK